MIPTSDTSPTTVTARSGAEPTADPWVGWRFWAVAGIWAALITGVVLSVQTTGMMVGIGIGHAWGPSSTADDWIGVWGWWIGIVIGVGIAAIGAIVLRRWGALVLALLILAAAGSRASGISDKVHPAVAPVEHVDPGPAPCACYSGSVCECPGG
jgi:hypothetical protein